MAAISTFSIRLNTAFALHSEAMQRGLATALAILFSWLLIAPAFAASSNFVVAPCCRKAGGHQCTMHSAESSAPGTSLRSVQAKCPYAYGSSTIAAHWDALAPGIDESVYAGLVQHPAVSPQTEASFRISYDRSRQKRGPPLAHLS